MTPVVEINKPDNLGGEILLDQYLKHLQSRDAQTLTGTILPLLLLGIKRSNCQAGVTAVGSSTNLNRTSYEDIDIRIDPVENSQNRQVANAVLDVARSNWGVTVTPGYYDFCPAGRRNMEIAGVNIFEVPLLFVLISGTPRKYEIRFALTGEKGWFDYLGFLKDRRLSFCVLHRP